MTIEEQRKEFEAALANNPDARLWNTTDAMFWAWQAARNQSNNVPVAWMNDKQCIIKSSTKTLNEVELSDYNIPLYTSPQQSNALEMARNHRDTLISIRQCFADSAIGKKSARLQINNARAIINKALSALIPQPESAGK